MSGYIENSISIDLSRLNSDAHTGQVKFGRRRGERKSDIGKRGLRKSRTVERIRDAIEEDVSVVVDVFTVDLCAVTVGRPLEYAMVQRRNENIRGTDGADINELPWCHEIWRRKNA